MSQRKAKYPWNTGARKMILSVHSANQVTQGKPVNELTVKIKVNKKTVSKTPKALKSCNPFWGHFHFFEVCPSAITFQLCDGPKEFGQYQLTELQHYAEDQIHEIKGDLAPRKAKTKVPVTGTITVRFFITKHPDRRSAFSGVEKKMYFYENYSEYFKTGDLILYSGRTPLDIASQLTSGVPYSHVGMVVEMPNPDTEQRCLYVAEVTQDLDGMLDMLLKMPRNGVSLFPLQERFHNYFGNAIWWLPLKEQLDLKSEMSLLKYLRTLHVQSNAANITPAPIQNEAHVEFLSNFGYSMKYPESLTEMWGPIMMVNALEQVPELRRGLSTVRLTPQHFAKKGVEWKSPFPEWGSNEKKATITVPDLTKLRGFATQYLVCCTSSLSHYVLDKSLKFEEFTEGNVNEKAMLELSPLFDAPMSFAKANKEALLERQKRVQNMILNQEEDLGKLGDTGSKSDDILSSSEGEEEAFSALKQQALQFNGEESEDPTLITSASVSGLERSKSVPPLESTGPPVSTNPFSQAQLAEPEFPWREYITQDAQARVYYHNASENKTQWDPPPGFAEYKSALAAYNLAKAQQAEAVQHSMQVRPAAPPNTQETGEAKKPEQFPQQVAAMNPFLSNVSASTQGTY